MKQYSIKIIGSGTKENIVESLRDLLEGLESSIETVGTSKGKMPIGDIFEDNTLTAESDEI